jgi:hypothetical protein
MKPRMSGMAEVARGSLAAEEAQRVHVGGKARHLLGRQVEVVDAQLFRLTQDVVVDVGDVAYEHRLVAHVPQPPL